MLVRAPAQVSACASVYMDVPVCMLEEASLNMLLPYWHDNDRKSDRGL
jgi:hypothetical protein